MAGQIDISKGKSEEDKTRAKENRALKTKVVKYRVGGTLDIRYWMINK